MSVELEWLEKAMDELAVHLEELDEDIDSDVVSGILRSLLAGHEPGQIIEDYGLELGEGV